MSPPLEVPGPTLPLLSTDLISKFINLVRNRKNPRESKMKRRVPNPNILLEGGKKTITYFQGEVIPEPESKISSSSS